MGRKVYKPTYKVNVILYRGRRTYLVSILEGGEFKGKCYYISRPKGKNHRFYQAVCGQHKKSFPLFPTLRDAVFAVTA